MVLVEDGILPVTIRVKQRQDEVRISSLVSILQYAVDFGIVEAWFDFQRFVEGIGREWGRRTASAQQIPQSSQCGVRRSTKCVLEVEKMNHLRMAT